MNRRVHELQQQAVQTMHTTIEEAGRFLRWAASALVVGTIVGGLIGLFRMAVSWAVQMRAAHPAILFALPLAGAAIVWLYHCCGLDTDPGTDHILRSVRADPGVHLRMAPLVAVSTVLTHLCGGSSGRMGAALQIGGSVSGMLGHWANMDEKDSHIITMCGMAAGFSALFGTPLAAAVFAMEVVSVGEMYYAAFFPCLFSAFSAFLVTGAMGLSADAYQVVSVPDISAVSVLQVVLLGIGCALVARLFCAALRMARRAYGAVFPDTGLRIAAGGVLVILLTLTVGTQEYNGAGTDLVLRAFSGEASPAAFLLKILFTAATLGAGYKGGDIAPAFFTGATFGCAVAPLCGLPASFGAGLGLAGVFCGVTNCPLTSILLAYELFGGAGLPLYALCCAVSYMLSGYSSLYAAQKILYSKFRAEYIDGSRR